jgi:hypothetical protein
MSATLAIAYILVGLLFPGYCLTRRLLGQTDLVERWVYAGALGMSAVPTLAFLAAWAFGLPFTRGLLLLVALSLVFASIPWRARSPHASTRWEWIALAVIVLCSFALLQATYVQDRADRFFDTCLHLSALFLQQTDASGWTLFHPKIGTHLTQVLSHDTSPVLAQGLLVEDQRPANGAFLAVFMVFAGRAGIELCALYVYFVMAGAAALVSRAFLRHPLARAAVGVATVVCLHGLVGYMVNESAFAAAAGLALLALMLREEKDAGVMVAAGLLFGFAVGSRLGALLWVLPLALLLFGSRRRWILAAAASSLVCSLPWLLVPWLVAGNPLFHPMSSWTESSFLGVSFQFWPLNWPFHEHLVRTPGFILPPLLLLPLLCIKSSGSVLASASLVGVALLHRSAKSFLLTAVFFAWCLPIALFLLVLAYIDHEKASWLLLGAPVLPLALAAFASALFGGWRRLWLLIPLAALAVPLTFSPGWLAGVELPEDPRGYDVVGGVTVGGGLNLVRGGKKSRDRMAELAVLPSLQRSSNHPSYLLDSLANLDAERSFEPGGTHAWLVDRRWSSTDLRFAMHTAGFEPALPSYADSPCGPEVFDDLGFWVHLGLPASNRVKLHVAKHGGAHAISIDPGPEPHQLAHVTFLARDHFDPPPSSAGLKVEARGAALPVKRYGYLCRIEGEDKPFHDLRLVTNLEPKQEPPVAQGELTAGGRKVSFEWMDLGTLAR